MNATATEARKHTPGPWRVGDAGWTVFGPQRTDTNPPMTCPEIIATLHSGNRKANARLIAAAPTMFDAIIEHMEHTDDNDKKFLCTCPRYDVLIHDCSKDRDEDHASSCRDLRKAIARATNG